MCVQSKHGLNKIVCLFNLNMVYVKSCVFSLNTIPIKSHMNSM